MSDTVAAIATPFGEGAIAVLRLSGEAAFAVANQALDKEGGWFRPRTAQRAHVYSKQGDVLDDVLVTSFVGPQSYTGEDVVEISCHGGVLVTQRILQRLLECGARAAEAGEFTQRAFLNGKMDLTQAEAVMDVISAQTELALRAAQHQLGGRIGEETEALRAELLGILAHVEAYIDFPEEDIDPQTGDALLGRLDECTKRIEALLATAEQGRILREGVKTVIYGEPNVGKSSLLNVLLGYDRAIVSELAGTTRDTVEEVLNVAGIPVRLIDTAGMREAADDIERRGVERTKRHVAEADLILEVVDASRKKGCLLVGRERENAHWILVLNKCDLALHPDWVDASGVEISCTEGSGLEELATAMRAELSLGAASWGQEAVAVNARHQDCLKRALEALMVARSQLAAGVSPEFAAVDLRIGLNAVGEVAGKVETEELLGEIFGQFCIGK